MELATERALSPPLVVSPVIVAALVIALLSRFDTATRRKFSVILLAGASGVYFNGGFGVWEFLFSAVVLVLAYLGSRDDRFIGAGWLLHTAWDVLHHLYGNPIIPMVPTSSGGCAICDLVLAGWYWQGAPALRWSIRPFSLKPGSGGSYVP